MLLLGMVEVVLSILVFLAQMRPLVLGLFLLPFVCAIFALQLVVS